MLQEQIHVHKTKLCEIPSIFTKKTVSFVCEVILFFSKNITNMSIKYEENMYIDDECICAAANFP